MAEQTGSAVAAMKAREEALSVRYREAAAADHELADVLAGAHAGAAAARNRIDTIAAAIEAAVQSQGASSTGTPLGAREFHNLLLVHHRELIAAMDQATRDAAAKQAVLNSLRARYSG